MIKNNQEFIALRIVKIPVRSSGVGRILAHDVNVLKVHMWCKKE